MQVAESGDYGNSVLPIQHLAVVGNHSFSDEGKRRSDAEVESMKIIPFIISTAAPSLLSLTLFGVTAGTGRTSSSNTRRNGYYGRLFVPDETIFPMLRDLIVLDQRVIRFHLRDGSGELDKRACQLRYPVLRSLYYDPGIFGRPLPTALPFLDNLRLNKLDGMLLDPPTRDDVRNVYSIIIDAPQYFPEMFDGSRDEYDNKFSKYQALIDEEGNPERSGIVVPVHGSTRYTNRGRILSAWADAVVGGEGCWTKAWISTTLCTRSYED